MSKSEVGKVPSCLKDGTLGPKIKEILASDLEKISGESLIKLIRQLEFWYASEQLDQPQLLDLTKQLAATATVVHNSQGFQVPKVRFGKTELRMPILTCGGMRLQKTWMPDDYGYVSPSKKYVVNHSSQDNIMNIIRFCLRFGINHFETARGYGTSEMQFAHAFKQLFESGEVKREDIILQTKIPAKATRAEFEKSWNSSWKHLGPVFGYVDLFAFHCVSTKESVSWVLSDEENMCMAGALQLQADDKIRHIGFSTHGTADHIMEMVNSEKFDYINVHAHYFGDYHGEGSDNTIEGGHGNKAIVKRALELDMGCFNISPFDKGGRVYAPSKLQARLIGPKVSPFSFAAWTSWKHQGFHTISVGFARPSDVNEPLMAAKLYAEGSYEQELEASFQRLEQRKEEALGKDWVEKGLLNLPTCEEEVSRGTAIGHILWCHNLIKAFGMYDFCMERYDQLEATVWSNSKPFQENAKNLRPANMGRGYDKSVDYILALSRHYDARLAERKMAETHEWLSKTNKAGIDRKAMDCEQAYDLRCWEAYPGDSGITAAGVLLQNFSMGYLGVGGGPTKTASTYGNELREAIQG